MGYSALARQEIGYVVGIKFPEWPMQRIFKRVLATCPGKRLAVWLAWNSPDGRCGAGILSVYCG